MDVLRNSSVTLLVVRITTGMTRKIAVKTLRRRSIVFNITDCGDGKILSEETTRPQISAIIIVPKPNFFFCRLVLLKKPQQALGLHVLAWS